jgi:hypothetical protein
MNLLRPSRLKVSTPKLRTGVSVCPKFLGTKKAAKSPRKVSARHKTRPDLKIFEDKREVCNQATKGGLQLYRQRLQLMVERQRGLCCNCRKPLGDDISFEHEKGRNARFKDERTEVDGKPLNGASHWLCNSKRGSKRTAIWHGEKE